MSQRLAICWQFLSTSLSLSLSDFPTELLNHSLHQHFSKFMSMFVFIIHPFHPTPPPLKARGRFSKMDSQKINWNFLSKRFVIHVKAGQWYKSIDNYASFIYDNFSNHQNFGSILETGITKYTWTPNPFQSLALAIRYSSAWNNTPVAAIESIRRADFCSETCKKNKFYRNHIDFRVE